MSPPKKSALFPNKCFGILPNKKVHESAAKALGPRRLIIRPIHFWGVTPSLGRSCSSVSTAVDCNPSPSIFSLHRHLQDSSQRLKASILNQYISLLILLDLIKTGWKGKSNQTTNQLLFSCFNSHTFSCLGWLLANLPISSTPRAFSCTPSHLGNFSGAFSTALKICEWQRKHQQVGINLSVYPSKE